MIGRCDVCGKKGKVFVAASTCGGMSFAYCGECLDAGREQYNALVCRGFFFDETEDAYKKIILLPSLQFHKKTKEEFDADVQLLLDALGGGDD